MEVKLLLKSHFIRNCNCYGIESENAVVVIDPGFFNEDICDFLANGNLKHRLILLTHCHYDHMAGAEELRQKTNVPIAIGEFDTDGAENADINRSLAGYMRKRIELKADLQITDGQIIKIGDIEIKAIHTPGHTAGSMSYLVGDTLFSGDTLFYETIGRTDLPTGNPAVIMNSLSKLAKLPPNTRVLPGHEEETTIEHELRFNPYMR